MPKTKISKQIHSICTQFTQSRIETNAVEERDVFFRHAPKQNNLRIVFLKNKILKKKSNGLAAIGAKLSYLEQKRLIVRFVFMSSTQFQTRC